MREFVAILLFLSVGLSAPAAGGPMRVCLAALIQAQVQDPECCDDCGDSHGEHAPCCVELGELPDAQTPSPMPAVPDVPVTDLGWQPVVPLLETGFRTTRVDLADPIRGPTSASSRRALLAIWRL